MKVSEEFKGRFFNGKNFGDKPRKFTIAAVALEEFDNGEKKLAVHFAGEDQALPLNATNRNTLTEAFGDETDAWEGKSVTLKPGMTTFQGKPVPTIFVEAAKK